jgi:dihydrofolate reductase
MRKLILYMQSTLNGRGADPNDEMFWVSVTDQTWQFVAEMQETCDAAVLSGKTYQDFLKFWPTTPEDESQSPGVRSLGRWMWSSEKLVFSRTLDNVDPSWPNTRLFHDVEEVTRLKDTDGKDMLLLGGIGIASSFARAGLIDEYWIHLNPTTIAEGRLLLNDRLTMKLLEVRPFDSGVAVLHYAQA